MKKLEKEFNDSYIKLFKLDVTSDINHHSLIKNKIDIVSLKLLQMYFVLIFNDFQYSNIIEKEIKE